PYGPASRLISAGSENSRTSAALLPAFRFASQARTTAFIRSACDDGGGGAWRGLADAPQPTKINAKTDSTSANTPIAMTPPDAQRALDALRDESRQSRAFRHRSCCRNDALPRGRAFPPA